MQKIRKLYKLICYLLHELIFILSSSFHSTLENFFVDFPIMQYITNEN